GNCDLNGKKGGNRNLYEKKGDPNSQPSLSLGRSSSDPRKLEKPVEKGKEGREDGKEGLDLALFKSSFEMLKTGPRRNSVKASPIPSNALHRCIPPTIQSENQSIHIPSDQERGATDKGSPEKVEAPSSAAQGWFGGDDASVVVMLASKVRQG
ncbi:hypothetical protein U1Q18_015535, partial [Sarracenia purpurea var. burkii]